MVRVSAMYKASAIWLFSIELYMKRIGRLSAHRFVTRVLF